MQGNAAQSGAAAQKSYAQQAQQLEQQNQQQGINQQQSLLASTTAAEQPYQALGQTATNAYTNLLNNPFQAPTLQQAQNTPGYQFNLQTGTQAINENAAATGNLNSGNTGVALQKYGQGLATNTYQQAYQNALNTYNTNLGAAATGVNTGLNSTQQLGAFNQQAANNYSNLYLTGGQQQASQLNNQGAAIAAGDVGSANAYANMLNGATNSLTQGMILSQIPNSSILGGNYSGGSVGGVSDPGLNTPSFMPQANPYANVSQPAAPNLNLNYNDPSALNAALAGS
jgi:hypothetical protein